MKFTIKRESLLKPLQTVIGAIERRQTLPILGNVLGVVRSHQLQLTGTDLEIQLEATAILDEPAETGVFTVAARKLMDICRSLPDEAVLTFELTEATQLIVKSGRSRFTLATLPAEDFPNSEQEAGKIELSVPQNTFRRLLEKTHFAVAQQDVRYYLNGLLVEFKADSLRCVATDGHRLALCDAAVTGFPLAQTAQIILPRKATVELMRLLQEREDLISIVVTESHFKVTSDDFSFVSKLVDGRYPDYKIVLPKSCERTVVANKELLKQMLVRASILSNEKIRGVRLTLAKDQLKVSANNPEQELAEEELSVQYAGEEFEIGFNVGYLLDSLNALPAEEIKLSFSDANSSVLIEEPNDETILYVVMPMLL